MANLPPEFKNLADMSPELKELMADKDGNGIPDIADNPFAMLGKLGQLSKVAKDMPVLVNRITTRKNTSGDSAPASATAPLTSGRANSLLHARNPLQSEKSPKPQSWLSASPPVKKDTGRTVLFWLAVMGFIGWGVWQYLVK